MKAIPTVREDGSEIWVTWNPERKKSATHKRFRLNPPDGAKIDRPAGFLFGLGQQFYFGDQVVHNVFLQTAVFAGVFALVALVVLFAAPALAAGSRRDAGVERTRLLLFVRVNLVMLFPWLMTHPLQYSRWYWAYYAAILGVGLRAALVEARAVPAQQATHDEPAADRPMATV